MNLEESLTQILQPTLDAIQRLTENAQQIEDLLNSITQENAK